MKNNHVAKNMHKTSKCVVHVDRKKRGKKGYSKHSQCSYSHGYSKFKKSFEEML